MSNPVKIPRQLAARLAEVSARAGISPEALVRTALAQQLDYEEWFLAAVDRGITDLDAGRTLSTRQVLAALEQHRVTRARRRRTPPA
jgi:predicted transcriptional regulator